MLWQHYDEIMCSMKRAKNKVIAFPLHALAPDSLFFCATNNYGSPNMSHDNEHILVNKAKENFLIEKEISIHASLRHPNVVPFIGHTKLNQ